MAIMTGVQLDIETEDHWRTQMDLVFNNEDYQPDDIATIRGGVRLDDISNIFPKYKRYCRAGGVL